MQDFSVGIECFFSVAFTSTNIKIHLTTLYIVWCKISAERGVVLLYQEGKNKHKDRILATKEQNEVQKHFEH